MSRDTLRLELSFIERQRRNLIALRDALLTADSNTRCDESQVREEIQGAPREYEDDAQKLAALELDGNLVVRDEQRLARVNRALQKIDEGTYGLSDHSGKDIPVARLRAVPEAICTIEEETEVELGRRA
jgi:DnaK suppressor protein